MRHNIIPYNPKLKQLARELRNNSTMSEVLLWQNLKGKRIRGYDFDRQKPLDNYIVDFFCNELMLAIEIDGSSHNYNESYEEDLVRQKELERLGVSFLRFNDIDVKKDMENVIRAIVGWIAEYEEKNNETHP